MDKKEVAKQKYKMLIDVSQAQILLLESRYERNVITEKEYKRNLKTLKNKISSLEWKIDHL